MPDATSVPRNVDIGQLSEPDFIHPLDATEHGYSGWSPESDREQYTVAGVTGGGTARVSDPPDPAAKKRVEAGTAALKGSAK